jgi:hypothetical protein
MEEIALFFNCLNSSLLIILVWRSFKGGINRG